MTEFFRGWLYPASSKTLRSTDYKKDRLGERALNQPKTRVLDFSIYSDLFEVLWLAIGFVI